MREIKFRAWDTKRNIFVPAGEIIFSDYGDTRITVTPNCIEYIYDDVHNGEPQGNRFKIMQYTGLKDKNGKEIYDGDIIKYKTNKIQHSLVQWIGDGFKIVKVLSPTRTRTSTLGHFISEYQCEVVGNICENPDLLTNK